jgi:hypothetical protein
LRGLLGDFLFFTGGRFGRLYRLGVVLLGLGFRFGRGGGILALRAGGLGVLGLGVFV